MKPCKVVSDIACETMPKAELCSESMDKAKLGLVHHAVQWSMINDHGGFSRFSPRGENGKKSTCTVCQYDRKARNIYTTSC